MPKDWGDVFLGQTGVESGGTGADNSLLWVLGSRASPFEELLHGCREGWRPQVIHELVVELAPRCLDVVFFDEAELHDEKLGSPQGWKLFQHDGSGSSRFAHLFALGEEGLEKTTEKLLWGAGVVGESSEGVHRHWLSFSGDALGLGNGALFRLVIQAPTHSGREG